jgi:hypothetical protein
MLKVIKKAYHYERSYFGKSTMTIIEIRPYRNGWQCFEAPGVQPYWTGESAKEDAIGYAKARAKFGHGEIRVLKQDGSIEEMISVGDPKTTLANKV